MPNLIFAQLEIDRRFVFPVGENVQTMTLFVRTGQKDFEKTEFGEFRFVPLLEDKN